MHIVRVFNSTSRSKEKDRHSKAWLSDIFKDGRELQHSYLFLEYADCVSITFEWQKKDELYDTVTQLASEHIIICPVRQWDALVKHIRNYPGSMGDTPMSAVWKNHRI